MWERLWWGRAHAGFWNFVGGTTTTNKKTEACRRSTPLRYEVVRRDWMLRNICGTNCKEGCGGKGRAFSTPAPGDAPHMLERLTTRAMPPSTGLLGIFAWRPRPPTHKSVVCAAGSPCSHRCAGHNRRPTRRAQRPYLPERRRRAKCMSKSLTKSPRVVSWVANKYNKRRGRVCMRVAARDGPFDARARRLKLPREKRARGTTTMSVGRPRRSCARPSSPCHRRCLRRPGDRPGHGA